MRERVFITGIGCISSFGVGHRAFADALLRGQSGISPITAFDTASCRSHLGGVIQGFDPTAFIAPLKLRRVDEVGRLALVCAQLVFEDAAWPAGVDARDGVGVALGTCTAGLDSTVAYLQGLIKDGVAGAPALLFSNTVSNAPASLCAIEHGLRGPNVTFNQREVSSLAALAFGVEAVRDGRVPAILTGGVDRLEETFFKVHDRFHALSPKRAGGEEAARPFDRRRNGFVLGEGGFVLLLESCNSAMRRGARVYAEVLGVGAASSKAAINAWPDDPVASAKVMALALEDAAVAADDVAAVFATANGCPDLDATEAAAVGAVFGGRRVPVTSIKGAIGESGAAGAAGVIAGTLTMPLGRVPPVTGWAEPDPACDVNVSSTPQDVGGNLFLVHNMASGGTHYAVVVRAETTNQL